ncbi:MAG: hypothetical protein AVDCRST_MAG40-348 [uncultured Gemmatimonadaceae bacterium]|uniref:Uncharacterized protein n=1 Tax=uncultured Gemmatimonadaceae bacterium TaxID=246130 RepID=A0A6J4KAY1_9BACT|nr:MAG: hypothetical protein AVDCRST_MAG40-348 [uncultured Gemmatimonadaceae bacterium]
MRAPVGEPIERRARGHPPGAAARCASHESTAARCPSSGLSERSRRRV